MPNDEKRPLVVIGTPSLYGDVCFPYLQSIVETVVKFNEAGIDWTMILQPGDPYLAKVRNSIATRALIEFPQMTHLFFIDADLGWNADAALRLVKSGHDVCAGIYPKKTLPPEFPCELRLDPENNNQLIERDGWCLANAVPTGFLCIKRNVLEKMAVGRGVYRDLDGKEKYNIFQQGFHPSEDGSDIGQWWGEDYAFCRQWNEMGGEIWVWPDIGFSHTGVKAYVNNFGASVAAFREGRAITRDAKPLPIKPAPAPDAGVVMPTVETRQ